MEYEYKVDRNYPDKSMWGTESDRTYGVYVRLTANNHEVYTGMSVEDARDMAAELNQIADAIEADYEAKRAEKNKLPQGIGAVVKSALGFTYTRYSSNGWIVSDKDREGTKFTERQMTPSTGSIADYYTVLSEGVVA